MTIYCISLPEEETRRAHILDQNFGFPITFVEAIRASHGGSFAAMHACSRSHAKVLRQHVTNFPSSPLLILEDDAELCKRERFEETLLDPPQSGHCLSLGSLKGKGAAPFERTHAMLFGPVTENLVAKFESFAAIYHGPPERVYATIFKHNLDISDEVIINFAPFRSSRTGRPQTPLPV